jgi:Domain of unknown function (DUF397)
VSLIEGDLDCLDWRKAKRSVNTGACVEVASAAAAVVVRDSLEVRGAVLRYPTAAWQSFLASASTGRYDAPRS